MGYPNTDVPRLPPFPVGTRLRCLGRAGRPAVKVLSHDGSVRFGVGLEVTIIDTHPGRQGTGRLMDRLDDEDIYDETTDGTSVYEAGGCRLLIRRENAHEWEVI